MRWGAREPATRLSERAGSAKMEPLASSFLVTGDWRKRMFIPLMMLAIESSGVVSLRMTKLMSGDRDAMREAELMINEKIAAAFEATGSLLAGSSPDQIVDRYRQHVGANAKRLRLGN
jgi:hypothetical protein